MDMAAIVTVRTPHGTIAKCPQGRIKISRDHGLRVNEEHATAAMALVDKLAREWAGKNKVEPINSPWCGRWIGGQTEDGMCFVYDFATNATSGIDRRAFIQNCEHQPEK